MPNKSTMKFSGSALARIRKAAKMSEVQLGIALHECGNSRLAVPAWVIRGYESGEAVPTGDRIGALASIFDVATDDLYTSV